MPRLQYLLFFSRTTGGRSYPRIRAPRPSLSAERVSRGKPRIVGGGGGLTAACPTLTYISFSVRPETEVMVAGRTRGVVYSTRTKAAAAAV